jgi:hypothetical protein
VDATFTTVAHILESQDIWIANTSATSHVAKHAEGRTKHYQTSVQTYGFAGEKIQPDCKMVIPITCSDKNRTEKFNVVLGEVQTNDKFHYNLFNVIKMLLKGYYNLEGDKDSLTLCNKTRLIVFNIIVCTQKLSRKCRRHVGNMSSRHKMSLQFWPGGSVLPTQDLRCRGLLCRLQPTLIFPAKTQVRM